MPGVVLSSYVLIALGVLVALAGYVARRRDHPHARYLLLAGGALVLLGVVGLGYVLVAFR